VTLNWTGASGAGYLVQVSSDGNNWATINSYTYRGDTATIYPYQVDPYLAADTKTCQVRIVAVNEAGSVASAAVTMDRPHQTPWGWAGGDGWTWTGYTYALTLNYNEYDGAAVTTVEVDWGDGDVQDYSPDSFVVTHAYGAATAPGVYDPIKVTLTDLFGTYTFNGPSVSVADPPSDDNAWGWGWGWGCGWGLEGRTDPDASVSGIELAYWWDLGDGQDYSHTYTDSIGEAMW
jgi:hypothetical protein